MAREPRIWRHVALGTLDEWAPGLIGSLLEPKLRVPRPRDTSSTPEFSDEVPFLVGTPPLTLVGLLGVVPYRCRHPFSSALHKLVPSSLILAYLEYVFPTYSTPQREFHISSTHCRRRWYISSSGDCGWASGQVPCLVTGAATPESGFCVYNGRGNDRASLAPICIETKYLSQLGRAQDAPF